MPRPTELFDGIADEGLNTRSAGEGTSPVGAQRAEWLDRHVPVLAAAAARGRGPYGVTTVPDRVQEMTEDVAVLLEGGCQLRRRPPRSDPGGRRRRVSRLRDLGHFDGAPTPYDVETGGTRRRRRRPAHDRSRAAIVSGVGVDRRTVRPC